MKKFSHIFIVFTAITLVFMAFNLIAAHGATEKVIYISADGTGDGSSPDKPLGNAEGYKTEVGSEHGNAFYRGIEKIKNYGGTVVIVGDVHLDSAHSRVPANKNDKKVPSEFELPSIKSGASITFTSVYDGIDYRQKGAKLILDHERCNTCILVFGFPANFTDIDMEYRYDPDSPNKWNVPFIIGGGGKALTIDKGVKVTSFNAKTEKEGDLYPILIGGARYDNSITNTHLTVRSGTWAEVIAGSFGMVDNTPARGTVNNTATLLISGGKIAKVVGSGSTEQPSGSVKGDINITVTGGEIDSLIAINDSPFIGKNVNIVIEEKANIQNFKFAVDSYKGDLIELASKVRITNRSTLVITPIANAPAIEAAPETIPPPETEAPATQPPSRPETEPETTAPYVTVPVTEDTRTFSEKMEQDVIHPKVLLWVAIAWSLIGLGFAARHYIKKWRVK